MKDKVNSNILGAIALVVLFAIGIAIMASVDSCGKRNQSNQTQKKTITLHGQTYQLEVCRIVIGEGERFTVSIVRSNAVAAAESFDFKAKKD